MRKVLLISMFFLFGCGSEETKTVSYYKEKQNQSELKDKLKYCLDSSERELEPNCRNAIDADAQLRSERLSKGL